MNFLTEHGFGQRGRAMFDDLHGCRGFVRSPRDCEFQILLLALFGRGNLHLQFVRLLLLRPTAR